ncbi:hypothetical protein [Leifsonia sp. NPDC080035]|uniref:Uncharacterized protein n=1 Tax=Leifsonia sp. NPDC080035 TaxID=3143936 RepID=A0AAU7GEK0_9MICO
MADFARYLPLSQRPDVDESGVSNDWRALTAERIEGLVARAASPSPADRALLAQLATRLSGTRFGRFARTVGISDYPEAEREEDAEAALATLREVAAARRRGAGPHGIAELVDVVRTEARCHSLGPVPALEPMVAGSVALFALTRAPLSVRAAVADRTLVPVDAPWRLGHGPELRTRTADILDFLLDAGPVPPAVPSPADGAE